MLDKIQTKISQLEAGKKLILGSGIKSDDMQKVVELCESLASVGEIKIVNKHLNPKTNNQPDTILIEKSNFLSLICIKKRLQLQAFF